MSELFRRKTILLMVSFLGLATQVHADFSLSGALTFDLFNNATPQVINYTTDSDEAVTFDANAYVYCYIDEVNKTIRVIPRVVTPSPNQVITIRQGDATQTFTVTITNSATTNTFEKVTDASSLRSGHIVTFVYSGESNDYALGAADVKNKRYGRTTVPISNNSFNLDADNTDVTLITLYKTSITLNNNVTEAWLLKTSETAHLITESSNAYLYETTGSVGNEGKPTIEITDGYANVVFHLKSTNRTLLRKDTYFSCYNTPGSPIQLYRRAKYDNVITVTSATDFYRTAADADELELTATAYCGPVTFAVKSADGLTEGEDFTLDEETGVLRLTGTGSGTITITASAPEGFTNKAGTKDFDVNVIGLQPVTLNSYGYATYCSAQALDFSEVADFSAWYITGTSGTAIYFKKITGDISSGQGIFLKGDKDVTVQIPLKASSDNVLSDNKLVGTLEPTVMSQVEGDYTNFAYNKSSNAFIKIKNGATMPANKAYLPIKTDEVPTAESRFSMIFSDDEETTAIQLSTMKSQKTEPVYDLQGRQVGAKKAKGLYIANGKKMIVK